MAPLSWTWVPRTKCWVVLTPLRAWTAFWILSWTVLGTQCLSSDCCALKCIICVITIVNSFVLIRNRGLLDQGMTPAGEGGESLDSCLTLICFIVNIWTVLTMYTLHGRNGTEKIHWYWIWLCLIYNVIPVVGFWWSRSPKRIISGSNNWMSPWLYSSLIHDQPSPLLSTWAQLSPRTGSLNIRSPISFPGEWDWERGDHVLKKIRGAKLAEGP